MADKKQNGNDNKSKEIKIDLNESAQRSSREESKNFSRGSEKAKNSASSEEGYISKPKISSEDTNNDKKK